MAAVPLLHWLSGMKPLIDMTARNDDTLESREQSIERARRRDRRSRPVRGPVWAVSDRSEDAA